MLTTAHHSEGREKRRILSDNSLRKIETVSSYLTFFLLGSFLGLAIGNTFDKFIGFPELITSNIDINYLSVVIGSAISIFCKIVFSLR